jgi:acetyl-CoA carboxylase biotin carboxylase subunit
MRKIKSLLIANRGEISLRIIRTAREMGIRTITVHSEADKNAPHVYRADESYLIGEAQSRSSYLDIEKIIQVAKKSKAEAIHPGYGFLSENAEFAKRVIKEGLIFVGPDSNSISVMGDKLSAKKAVLDFNVPLIPGTNFSIKNIDSAILEGKKIGFPIMIKASAGGGGKGMRIANSVKELKEMFPLAKNEALKSFGNDEVFIEKYISSPRHIEIQVLGDSFGNFVHLLERDCSIQRRHQKVVEEAPSSLISPKLRQEMGLAAINAAKSCGYVNAGTVEFICDTNGSFYFLEMNTRLQVEHPVTELITGVDIVKEQLRISMGEQLSFNQVDVISRGHAMELRIYAEDCRNNFSPDTGFLEVYRRPQGPGVRVDDGIEEGMEISIHYDPMIAKLIVHAQDRESCIDRMKRAIDDYVIIGVETTLPFGKFVMNHPDFLSGEFNTHFVEKNYNSDQLESEDDRQIALALHKYEGTKMNYINESNNTNSRWRSRFE